MLKEIEGNLNRYCHMTCRSYDFANPKMAVYLNQLNQTQDLLSQELSKLENCGESTRQDRYSLHKVYFESLIDQHSTYRDLLSRIKAEYEHCIAALERGQREAVYLSEKLAATLMEHQTFRKIKARADELELKVTLLRIHNQRLSSRQIRSSDHHSSRQNRSSNQRYSSSLISPGSLSSWDHSHTPRSRFFPSLTVEKLTDTAFLTKKLADLKSQVAVAKLENDTKFVPKVIKGQLFNRLREKEEIKDALLERRDELKKNIISVKFRLAVRRKGTKTTKAGNQRSSYFRQLCLALKETHRTMEEAVKKCEEEAREETNDKQHVDNPSEGVSSLSLRVEGEDDDPTKDQEAEFVLEYIENFFEVYEAGKIEDAVMLAAHSPKGVLRSMETLAKFEEYDATHTGSSVLMSYWEAVLPTVSTGCKKPSQWETLECVRCVLARGRTDLLTHWIAQNQLTLSEEAGRLISEACRCPNSCTCGLTGLAEAVFENVGAHKEVLGSLLKQGRFHKAVNYLGDNENLARTDFIDALQKLPLTDAMLSFLCGDRNENCLFSINEAADLLAHVLVNSSLRHAANREHGEGIVL